MVKSTNMVDTAKIIICAGKGGDGAVSFRREKFVPKGGPDGGDGGRGGSIWFEVDSNINTLQDFANRRKYLADDGKRGGSKKMSGLKGDDLVIKVPQGTVVRLKRLEREKKEDLEIKVTGMKLGVMGVITSRKPVEGMEERELDMSESDMRVLVARGGKGGKGNVHFKNSKNTTPMKAEGGQEGELFEVEMELKILADVGLVGLPNAGKSTLLSVLTKAQPKIAPYPFTTLEPSLGVLKHKGKTVIIADIPGLIEGASEGRGLGIQFLRHIERTRILVHLVSMESGDADQMLGNYLSLREELEKYSPELAEKREILVFTKADLVDEVVLKKLQSVFKKRKLSPIVISSGTRFNIEKLEDELIS